MNPKLADFLVTGTSWLLFATFLVLQLTGVTDWSWWIVALPLYWPVVLVVGLLGTVVTIVEGIALLLFGISEVVILVAITLATAALTIISHATFPVRLVKRMTK